MTSHEAQLSVSLMFLPHYDVNCDLSLVRPTAKCIYLFYMITKQNVEKDVFRLITIQMKAIEQFFSSCVSVYQAVHRGFNLKSLDKTLVCNHVNEDIKAHALSFGNFSLVYRKT